MPVQNYLVPLWICSGQRHQGIAFVTPELRRGSVVLAPEGSSSPVCVFMCQVCALREMVSDSGSCLCLSCGAGVILLAQHSAQASLALPSQRNNKHASQANSSCHVVNGVGYTSWRPAEVLTLRGGLTNTMSLEVGQGGWGRSGE